MVFPTLLQKSLVGSFALVTLAAATASVEAADVSITDAKIAGGKLVISGTTAGPNSWVRLDGQKGAAFNVKSGADGAFSFGVVYHPGDCIVELQRLISSTVLGAATEALVANCGPVGISPRGAWSAADPYATNDLVTYEGSSWRAKRDNAGRQPGAAAEWELFAAKGEPAETESQTSAAGAALEDATGPAGGDLTGTYPNPTIRAGAVGAGKIAIGAVDTVRIANAAVTAIKIAPGAVATGRLHDNAVTTPKLADNAITTTKILDETITSADLATNSVGSSEIQDGAVGNTELADNAVTGAKVASNSLTTADIAGADVNGAGISIPTGYVPNGRCRQVDASVGGAKAGEAVIFSIKAALQDGILIYGQRVPSDGHVTFNVCNFSGTTQAAISDLPVRIITFG